MPNKEFLEKYSLYRKYNFEPKKHWNKIDIEKLSRPAINIYCPVCKSNQTYNATEDSKYEQASDTIDDKIYRLQYVCNSCYKHIREFILKFHELSKWEEKEKEHTYFLQVEKIGQYPPWSIEADKVLERLLGEHADYYKKGLVCESQNYGIGADAYFRRITENIIDNLLNSIADLMESEEKEKYKKALEETKKTKRTEDKIDLVKDLLPLSLKPNGMNPLKTLHSALSVGIHSKTDEECMDQAEIIKNVLVFLVNQILKTEEDKKKFTDSMKKLLGKK